MRRATLLVIAGIVLGVVRTAAADEAKTPVSAALLLSIMSSPVESRGQAYDEAIKREGPAPAGPMGGVVQPDGSVRYGNVTVTVRNPCPPGTHFFEPVVPGRRAKN